MKWLVVLLTLACADAQQTNVRLDPGATQVQFTVGDVLHTVHGTFQLSQGELWLDPSSGKAGGRLVVNGASGSSGSGARDGRMKKNILETNLYPEITFVPDHIEGKVELSGHSEFKLHGLFTIHGATHVLTMNVKTDIQGDHLTAVADFSVPYVQWGMKNPSTLFLRVNETVPIEIHAVGQLGAAADNKH